MNTYNKTVLTFDTDWAPDFVLKDLHELLSSNSVKSTWFITHDSEYLDELKKDPNVELGIHPNFYSDSTQGRTYFKVIEYLMNILPEALSFRSHSVYLNGDIYKEVLKNTNIKFDSTFFLPYYPISTPIQYKSGDRVILRVPFCWADDYEISQTYPNFNCNTLTNLNGLKVLCFHPIHVFINSSEYQEYNTIKDHIFKEKGTELNKKLISSKNKYGVRNFLESIIQNNHETAFIKLNELK